MKTTKQQQAIALKTMAMKAKVSNWIRTNLHGTCHPNKKGRWAYRNHKVLTDAEKIEFFDQLYKMYKDMNEELRFYKNKRQYKDLVQKEREARKSVLK